VHAYRDRFHYEIVEGEGGAAGDTPESLREKLALDEPQRAPRGAQPIELAPPPGAEAKAAGKGRGLFGRIFGGRQ
jgi:hypothetical protein